jgi:hypothetical protein
MARSGRILSIFFFIFACGISLLMPACGGGSSGSSNPPTGTTFSSLELSPAALTILRGNTGTSTLTATTLQDFHDAVELSLSGAPAGVAVTFEPRTVSGTGSSTMTLTVAPGTATGNYSIVVTGDASGIQKSAQLDLNVTAQVFLQWSGSGSGNIVGYNIARSTMPGQGYVRINSTLISDTFYNDETVQSGHTYYYLATAVDAFGNESAPSNEATAEVD